MQDIARARERLGKGRGELMQAESETDDAKKPAEKNKDNCQKKGHVKGVCRNRQLDMKKAKDSSRRQQSRTMRSPVW